MSKFTWLLLAAAALAVAVAIGAVVVGQRKQEVVHPLKGSVARRKGLFQSFTDCALCDTIPTDGKAAQQRHLEMTYSRDDYGQCSV